MFVAGSFEYNLHLELAISELEKKGIPRDAIAAFIMDSRVEERKILDTIHRADGISSFDAAALLGTFLMLLGAIYGFVLPWGPIIWGIIGFITGSVLGFLGDVFIARLYKRRDSGGKTGTNKGKAVQVVLIVECDRARESIVRDIMWDNLALGVGALPG
ncbi:MAG: hypothetical protein ABRQ24_02160 [Syntrophomonadaceae bacterium]